MTGKTTQPATGKCDRCGRPVYYVRETPHEFGWDCPGCSAGVISWSHAHPPPAFDPVLVVPTQGDLFTTDANGGILSTDGGPGIDRPDGKGSTCPTHS